MNEVQGMESVVTSLTTSVSAANLWGIVGNVVPFLAKFNAISFEIFISHCLGKPSII